MNLEDSTQPVRIIYKQVPVESLINVSDMFGFLNNKVHIKCSFESVRRLYVQYLKEKDPEYKVTNFRMSINDKHNN